MYDRNGQIDCKTTSAYKAADMSLVLPGNIKSGVTIAGQAGDFPSVAYPLTVDAWI